MSLVVYSTTTRFGGNGGMSRSMRRYIPRLRLLVSDLLSLFLSFAHCSKHICLGIEVLLLCNLRDIR